MKRILFLILVPLVLTSCQFNQSIIKDLSTGAYYRGDGIGCDDVYIEINGEVENRNEFVYGETVTFAFNNVSGFQELDNKKYPGISFYILKNEKDTIAFSDDLLKNTFDDGTDMSPLLLEAYFVSNLPYENDEEYTVYIKIWDKQGDGTFSYELPFTVKENQLLDITNNGFEYNEIYLWNNTKEFSVSNKEINLEDELILIFNGFDGLKNVDSKVFPEFSLTVTDKSGNKILSEPNLFKDYENSGINPVELKEQFFSRLNFTKGRLNNPYKMTAIVKDQKSFKEIMVTAELMLNQ